MLHYLTEEEFTKRVADGARTPVYREYLADRETPVSVLTRVTEDDAVFLLESVSGGENRGRYSYLGIDPYETVFEDALENPLKKLRPKVSGKPFLPAPELPSLQGGAIGYLAYDVVRTFVPRVGLTREPGTPIAAFLLTDTILIFDNVRQTIIISHVTGVAAGETAHAAYARAMAVIDGVYQRLLTADSIARYMARRGEKKACHVGAFTSEMTQDEFTDMVLKCKAAIKAGEVIQIVPSQKFTAETDISPLSLYRALRMVNPSPYNFFLKLGGKTLIGSSPEELVKLEKGVASTCPIAGTRPRGQTREEDLALEAELVNDPKERAEHVMLVDLGRNDLGKVSKFGSVAVETLHSIERYSHVMHIGSTVRGEIREGLDALDAVEAVLPAGTLSGAPKIRACQLIGELENNKRGIYGGAIGYIDFTGNMDTCIAIRIAYKKNGRVFVRSGAGIVADSVPEKEYEECINKAKAVVSALKLAEEAEL